MKVRQAGGLLLILEGIMSMLLTMCAKHCAKYFTNISSWRSPQSPYKLGAPVNHPCMIYVHFNG